MLSPRDALVSFFGLIDGGLVDGVVVIYCCPSNAGLANTLYCATPTSRFAALCHRISLSRRSMGHLRSSRSVGNIQTKDATRRAFPKYDR